ncbi:MAG: cytochrome b562 [Acinetobacter populi]|jgi:soluble cytochrome b562|uniref:cytochrome b562 n=1 Tax=Acinetobacter populi TaxID=1582270 RepID=UPI00235284B5|nr:cytochrome b562 [Acinetobacter populi]MCH4247718.1 cytochrome b562 [Acinetobacter populi]
MKKAFFTGIMVFNALMISNLSMAADLGEDMSVLAKNYQAFNTATTTTDALQALAQMHTASLDAKQSTPMKLMDLPEDDPQIKAYQNAMDRLTTEIDEITDLVKAGKLEDAKQQGKVIEQMKSENHKLFK